MSLRGCVVKLILKDPLRHQPILTHDFQGCTQDFLGGANIIIKIPTNYKPSTGAKKAVVRLRLMLSGGLEACQRTLATSLPLVTFLMQ